MFDGIYQLMNSGSVIGLFLGVVPITLLVGIAYAIYRYVKIKKHDLGFSWGQEIVRLLFVCYLTGLVNLVLVPDNLWINIWFYVRNGYSGGALRPLFSGGFNLVPTLVKVLAGELTVGSWVRTMLTVNLLMFVPMGIFLPFVLEKLTSRSALIIAVGIPLAVEVVQPIIGRSFDIDDIIMNFIGIMVGYAAAIAIKTLLKKRKSDTETA